METSEYLQVDSDSPTPLEVQLTEQLRWLIVRGQIRTGEKLPPARQLGNELGINMHTALAVYRRLSAAGLAESRPVVNTRISLPTQLITRHSCGCPPQPVQPQ